MAIPQKGGLKPVIKTSALAIGPIAMAIPQKGGLKQAVQIVLETCFFAIPMAIPQKGGLKLK